MRQQGGDQLIELLNSVRVGNLFADDAFFLKLRQVNIENSENDVYLLFAFSRR